MDAEEVFPSDDDNNEGAIIRTIRRKTSWLVGDPQPKPIITTARRRVSIIPNPIDATVEEEHSIQTIPELTITDAF